MLSIKEIEDYFSQKTDVEMQVVNFVIRLKLKDGIYDHSCNAPETLKELDKVYNEARFRLARLEKKKSIQKQAEEGMSLKDIKDLQPTNGCNCNGEENPSGPQGFTENNIEEIDNTTWGVKSLAEAALSGDSPRDIQEQRFNLCKNCNIKDLKGEKLFREINGVAYCGIPRLSELGKIKRDERHWGCGCKLVEKIAYNASQCPFRVWESVQI